jgi:hypothetical protein
MTDTCAAIALSELVELEMRSADLGDARLDRRLAMVLSSFLRRPLSSIPVSCGGWGGAKGAYRLMSNSRVTPKKILEPHLKETILRCRESAARDILVIGDTTDLDFSGREKTKGLGPKGSNQLRKPLGLGLKMHTSFAVTGDGLPLGVLENRVWARDPGEFGKTDERQSSLPIFEKESAKWLDSLEAAAELRHQVEREDTRTIAVFDREGDVYSVFGEAREEHQVDVLIRSTHNRVLSSEGESKRLWDQVSSQEIGVMRVEVPRGKSGQRERSAELSVYAAPVSIKEPPRRPKGEKDYGEIDLNAVLVREENAPKGTAAIEWKLLTSLPIADIEQIELVISYYKKRWLIERFFRVLKSGCKVEKRQFETAERIENCLALDSVVAWMILYLTILGRQTPDVPCTTVFEDCEWQAVWVWVNQRKDHPEEPPTLEQMVRMIGRLGGHLGRRGDGMPGSETLWRGMQRVPDLAGMWSMLTGISGPPDSRSRTYE